MENEQSIQVPLPTEPQIPVNQIQSQPQSPSIPTIPAEIPKKSFSKSKALIILVIVILFVSLGYFGYKYSPLGQNTNTSEPTPTTTPTTPSDPTANWEERKFESLNLTFKAPSNLTMEESEPSPGQLVAHLQNDKIGDEFFQMYFIFQKNGKQIKDSDIPTLKNDPKFIIPGTERDIEVDNYSGFAGQVADKSKRFVSAIVKDGYWLIIYTAEPTQTNKELSDRIMSTFKFTD